MTPLNYSEYKDKVLSKIKEASDIVLATCADNVVTTRIVCPLLYDSSILISTGINSNKSNQIKKNPYVAFSLGELNIEAVAYLYGHPSTHPTFKVDYDAKFPHLGSLYKSSPDDVLIIADVKKISIYSFTGKPCKDIIDFEAKQAYRIEL